MNLEELALRFLVLFSLFSGTCSKSGAYSLFLFPFKELSFSAIHVRWDTPRSLSRFCGPVLVHWWPRWVTAWDGRDKRMGTWYDRFMCQFTLGDGMRRRNWVIPDWILCEQIDCLSFLFKCFAFKTCFESDYQVKLYLMGQSVSSD